ncbi:MAG: PCRF domain-containing protein, partial [Flavobacteriaceae bacterium]|nr:PCRF domain-containing protein [Candidatus Onthonaster equi]
MVDLGLLDKSRAIKQRFDEVADLIIQPDIVTDQARYAKLNKEYSDLRDFVEIQKTYEGFINAIDEADEIIADGSDAEMVELAKLEKDEAINAIPALEEEIKMMLIP